MEYYIHALDPAIFRLGPFVLRWYALAYVIGILCAWRYCVWLIASPPYGITKNHLDDFLFWAVLGVILGGRLGFVVLYYPHYYLSNPLEILKIWQGGMAFHGGVIGMFVVTLIYCRRTAIPLKVMGDLICAAVPIGLFFGRIANFINGELWGRVTDVSWAVIFPMIDAQPRHPSQLYESALEGLMLFVGIFVLVRFTHARQKPGLISGVFFAGYGIARMISEIFREPEILQNFLPLATTWGQWLSLPMVILGAVLMLQAYQNPPLANITPKPAKSAPK